MFAAITMTWLLASAIVGYIGCEFIWQNYDWLLGERIALWWWLLPMKAVFASLFLVVSPGVASLLAVMIVAIGCLAGCAASIHELFSSEKVK